MSLRIGDQPVVEARSQGSLCELVDHDGHAYRLRARLSSVNYFSLSRCLSEDCYQGKCPWIVTFVPRFGRSLVTDLCFALTDSMTSYTLYLPGETEAGSAGAQPARDSRSGLRRNVGREVGILLAFLPQFWCQDIPEHSPMPQKNSYSIYSARAG